MKNRDFSFHLFEKMALLLAGVASAVALGGALISQYGFSLYPCELCIYQRYPYAIIIAISALALIFLRSLRYVRYALMLCVLLFAVDAGIAVYHSGVELDVFEGPSTCSASNKGEQTIEQLRAEILGAPLVSCKQAMAYFLGLSMAMWNAIFASVMSVWMVIILWKRRSL